jgi:hypothetical protein
MATLPVDLIRDFGAPRFIVGRVTTHFPGSLRPCIESLNHVDRLAVNYVDRLAVVVHQFRHRDRAGVDPRANSELGEPQQSRQQ